MMALSAFRVSAPIDEAKEVLIHIYCPLLPGMCLTYSTEPDETPCFVVKMRCLIWVNAICEYSLFGFFA